MEMTNANSLTRESAIQTVQDEVMLNAAYIDGKWMTIEAPATDTADADSYDSNHDSSYDLYDSNSGTIIATTRLCTKAQVEMAVNAASMAYPSWSQTDVSVRASYLNAIAETMEQQFDKLVGLSVLNNGRRERCHCLLSLLCQYHHRTSDLVGGTHQRVRHTLAKNVCACWYLRPYCPVEFSNGHYCLEVSPCIGCRLYGAIKALRGDIIARVDAGQYIVCYQTTERSR